MEEKKGLQAFASLIEKFVSSTPEEQEDLIKSALDGEFEATINTLMHDIGDEMGVAGKRFTYNVQKLKRKRPSRGIRKHNRRVKQEERKELRLATGK